ncbi:putative cytochrome P450 [Helianthus annuus]|uniref:Cytochrome P450 n=1 Tax=Helianthus annuus TaxID=4232 RepID=A0A251UXI1_HELAN|nr:cytochrome P450 Tp4149 [Helianthus annuus]KAF5808772.1 putative cytochrome P450 [Helianthus annuus]KAJ0579861.1 putative cytochrome P450 [Helianthus annuus]KAJ0587183.1 putative cytochrome P450 [Helianthus annuus]KAJ0595771.1 putative cytochrome P450 [Helianthus annuus]KAJ0756429.1 putative cytochrome P450 [Helianthus annuus]
MEPFSSFEGFLPSSISCILLVMFICVKWISFDKKNRKNIPPSPRKLPIIGNFHQLGSNPNHNLHIMSQKYGPVMLLHLGSIPTLVASSAEAAHEIMKTHDLSFCSRPNLLVPNILFYGSKSISFAPYGEYWRQLKSLVVLKLLSNTRVKSYQKVRENEIVHMIQMLQESCGTTIDMGSTFASLTNNIISRVALGKKLDGPKYRKLLRVFVDTFNVFNVGSYIPWLSWVDRVIGTVGRAEKIAKEFDEFLERIIEEHVNKENWEDARSNEGEDFVDVLLDLQKHNTSDNNLCRDSLKALIMEAFAAGTDTTYATLEWAMSELIKNSRVMKKLQEEVTEIAQGRDMISEEDLEKMPYLKAVIKETLRLHPPFSLLLPRKSMQDVKLMGYDIAAGTQVFINAWAIGRDPALWEEPNEFRPERLLYDSINYQGLQFEWIPFGVGRRSCPGIQFSVPVMELALANIVYKFDLSLPGIKNEDLDMSEAFGVTIHRKCSLIVSVIPRFS